MNRSHTYAAALTGFLGLAAVAASVYADDSGGFGIVYKIFFGKESDKTELKSCANANSHATTPMGRVNAFFCRMEKEFGISQAPTLSAPVSSTIGFDGSRKIHVEISGQAGSGGNAAQGFNDDGTSNASVGYDYLAKVWLCKANGSVTCTAAADFNLAVVIAWSYNPDGTVNKGYMLQDPGARDLSNQGASVIVYNVGSNATKKMMSVKDLEGNGDRFNISAYRDATGILSAAMVFVPNGGATDYRFSTKINTSSGVISASFEQPAASTSTVTAGAATCYNRRDDGQGDWSYSPGSGSCPAVDNYGDTKANVAGYTASGLLGISGSNWTSGITVSVHPSSI